MVKMFTGSYEEGWDIYTGNGHKSKEHYFKWLAEHYSCSEDFVRMWSETLCNKDFTELPRVLDTLLKRQTASN